MEGIRLSKFKIKKLEEMRLDPNIGPPTIAIIGKRNSGKCLGEGTKIIMYDGSVKCVENIVENDLLMGPDSTPRKVSATTSGTDRLYIVQQDNGDDYIVNSKHILTLYRIDTGTVVDINIQKVLKEGVHKFYGLKSNAIQFESRQCKIDPYKYGNLIYHINTSVDESYMINRVNIRRNFLYGVLDRWSKKEEVNDDFVFHFKKDIPDDIKWVARSLGYIVSNKQIIINNDTHIITPISIKLLKFGTYYGFDLDGDKRFLLNDFTITHNTYLEKDIMYTMRKMPNGVFMCPSAGGRESISEIFPDTYIYNDLDLDIIEKIMSEQTKKREKYGNDLKVCDYSTSIICDDCATDRALLRNKTINELIYNGRHSKIFFIFPMQDCMTLSPGQRDNMDFVFLCRTPHLEMRRKLHKTFFGIIPNFQDFCDILDKCTENYGCLVFDNTVRSNNPEDCIFWYRARDPLPKFKYGSKEFWEYHKKNKSRKKKKEEKGKKKLIIVKSNLKKTSD